MKKVVHLEKRRVHYFAWNWRQLPVPWNPLDMFVAQRLILENKEFVFAKGNDQEGLKENLSKSM